MLYMYMCIFDICIELHYRDIVPLILADLSLNEIRRMYFDMKNDVFVDKIGDVMLPDEQTEVLEGILKKKVGEQTTLGSKTHPK